MRFMYSATINKLPAYDDKVPVEKLIGTLETKDFNAAKKQAKTLAWNRCEQLKNERGSIFGYENVQVAFQAETPVTNMNTEQIIALIQKHLDQAAKDEAVAAQAYQQSIGDEERQATMLNELRFCAGRKMALHLIVQELQS